MTLKKSKIFDFLKFLKFDLEAHASRFRTFPCVSDVPEHAVLSTDGSEHASHVINDPSVNVRFGQVQSPPLMVESAVMLHAICL